MRGKSIFISIVTAAFLMVCTQMAMADFQVSLGGSYGPYQAGEGGEFTLAANTDLQAVLGGYVSGKTSDISSSGTFQTFCLERNEYLYTNSTYDVSLSNAAVFGGVAGGSGTPTSDPISQGTAYLYSAFRSGTLSGYNYTGDRASSAIALQNTIWWLENELDDPGVTNIFRNAVIDLFGSAAQADYAGSAIMAANLWVPDHIGEWDYRRQSVLVATPIPAAAWLLASGLIGLTAIRRRKISDWWKS